MAVPRSPTVLRAERIVIVTQPSGRDDAKLRIVKAVGNVMLGAACAAPIPAADLLFQVSISAPALTPHTPNRLMLAGKPAQKQDMVRAVTRAGPTWARPTFYASLAVLATAMLSGFVTILAGTEALRAPALAAASLGALGICVALNAIRNAERS